MSKRLRTPLLLTTATLMVSAPLVSQALASESHPPPSAIRDAAAGPKRPEAPRSMPSPDTDLGKGWKNSEDRAVTGAADAEGFRILVADESKAYAWKAVATLSEPGMPADSWIGNQCVMDDSHVAAVYAPRAFTNKPDLMQGGAFTAIVNTRSGEVTKLPFTATLAYFDPSCNTTTHTAAFTQYRDMNDASKVKTRVVTVDTGGRTVTTTGELRGQVSSAVPVKDGVVAGLGRGLVHINDKGGVRRLAQGASIPFDIRPMTGGRIGFVDRKGTKTARAKVYDGHGEPRTVATGRLGDLELTSGAQGRAFLTGDPEDTKTEGSGITKLDAPADTDVSSHGHLAVNPVLTPGVRAGLTRIQSAGKGFDKADEPAAGVRARSGRAPGTADGNAPITVTSTATVTGRTVEQQVTSERSHGGNGLSPALTGATRPRALAAASAPDSHDPRDTDRWCSVSRNDMSAQALQPTPNQVEWAVDMAVRGELRDKWIRQDGYRGQAGLGSIDPQGLFPLPKLIGGGRIPANVLLGIMAQESNLWQAESGAIPGQMGNPLAAVDGYYGHNKKDTLLGYWRINWEKSDCGYGVGQVTDGMRLKGREKEGETSLDPKLQKAVAVDYATNIAASMKILADKWNEVHADGQKITVNNDDPSRVENWFTAAWNYNLGFNPKSDASKNGGHWGLGWYNNPANPMYKKGAWDHPFMDVSLSQDNIRDAAHPQYWPYEEKVMGWSAWSIDTGFSYGTDGRQDWKDESGFSSAGFRPAWWLNAADRSRVSPPLDTFCNKKNNCDSANPKDCPDEACYRQFWWAEDNATWKANCDQQCGRENIKYDTLRSEPGRGYRLKNGEPVCAAAPKGAEVVTSIPNDTDTWSSCGRASSKGSFEFTFLPDSDQRYEAKADLHSIGGGHGGHFWYSHTRNEDNLGGDDNRMTIKGKWTLGHKLDWARVLVHLPDTGAQTRQAAYVVHNADTTSPKRLVTQRADRWVSLGVFQFTGTPQVELSNTTQDGTADEDIAWGSIAFQPLPGKPKNAVVAMGDSYSSGEGASEAGGKDFYPESDHYDKLNEKATDSCHRSRYAWSRQAALPGQTRSIGELADDLDPQLDYHLVACSGARHYHILSKDQMGEGKQIDTGYLDNNTTLVTLSIGGNDARFTDVFKQCVFKSLGLCQNSSMGNKNPDTGAGTDGETGPLKDWAPKWLHDEIRPRIAKTLNEIHKRAPHARIVLMGYPRLLSALGQCIPGIGTAEAPWLNTVADTSAHKKNREKEKNPPPGGGGARSPPPPGPRLSAWENAGSPLSASAGGASPPRCRSRARTRAGAAAAGSGRSRSCACSRSRSR
ncbi:SGNH/GDSL hydrolase family protein [Streptomyces sp. NRRL B-1347]|uniref:SGNH/GDSL hydrolase family protein n=1 Tax=Streptomyces sp. NRRL B-1347 TaxID=1476877 RepID=UPI00068FF8A8|nr:SGNH/GDSL hydrolase family protein [Streptomyces sp. NRRL B-1347]